MLKELSVPIASVAICFSIRPSLLNWLFKYLQRLASPWEVSDVLHVESQAAIVRFSNSHSLVFARVKSSHLKCYCSYATLALSLVSFWAVNSYFWPEVIRLQYHTQAHE